VASAGVGQKLGEERTVNSSADVWVVILAAGEGHRVRGLTRDRWGNSAPKQYSCLDGATTLLGTTLERAKRITPPERIVPIVAAQHQCWWDSELTEIPPENIIVQPENRGTAAGILLPLLWITRRDSDALLVILPSDHDVAREEILHTAMTEAVACAAGSQAGIVLLGVKPEGPETDYGWIVPRSGEHGSLRSVALFREKPDAATSAVLLRQGALLNCFILIAQGRVLLDLFETVTPRLWRFFHPVSVGNRDGNSKIHEVSKLYRSVPVFDFSKDLLEQIAEKLSVYTVPSCGWCDLGTPERLNRRLIQHSQPPWGVRILSAASGRREAIETAPVVKTHALA
jgi:mannose-1-phosphate guanylyltransferase